MSTSLNCNYHLNSLSRYISFSPDVSAASFEFRAKIKDNFRFSPQDTWFFILGSTISVLHFLCCLCRWLEKQYFIRTMGYCQHPSVRRLLKACPFLSNSECKVFTDVIYLSSSDTRERIAKTALKPGFVAFGTSWYFSEPGEVVLNLPLPLSLTCLIVSESRSQTKMETL